MLQGNADNSRQLQRLLQLPNQSEFNFDIQQFESTAHHPVSRALSNIEAGKCAVEQLSLWPWRKGSFLGQRSVPCCFRVYPWLVFSICVICVQLRLLFA